jgi:hypothetical protein
MPITLSKLYEHAIRFYDRLEEGSNMENLPGYSQPFKVFRGSLTLAYKELAVSMAYYTPIRRLLEESGAVQYLRQGNRNQSSCVVLLERPHAEKFDGIEALTPLPDHATLERRVRALEQRLEGVAVVKTLADFEARLRALEGKTKGRKQAHGKTTQRTAK